MRVWGCFVTRSYNWKCWRRYFSILDLLNKEKQKQIILWESENSLISPNLSQLTPSRRGKCKFDKVEDCWDLAGLNLSTFLCDFPPYPSLLKERGKCWCFCVSFCLSVLWWDQTLHCISVRYFSARLFSKIFQSWDWTERGSEAARLAIPADGARSVYVWKLLEYPHWLSPRIEGGSSSK